MVSAIPMPLEGASLLTLALITGIIFVAGLVHGTLGLGFPLVATALMALFLDLRSAILITLLPTAAVNIASILRGGRWGDSVGKYWPLAAYAIVGGVVGTWFIIIGDPEPFKLLLALLILVYLGSSRLAGAKMSWVPAYPGWSMLLFGLAAGFASGSTNVMVPILIIFALETGLAATAMVQVFNMCFLAGKLTQFVVFAAAGVVGSGLLISTAPLAAVALTALAIGMAVRDRIPAESYRTVVKGALFVAALMLIGQYLFVDLQP